MKGVTELFQGVLKATLKCVLFQGVICNLHLPASVGGRSACQHLRPQGEKGADPQVSVVHTRTLAVHHSKTSCLPVCLSFIAKDGV